MWSDVLKARIRRRKQTEANSLLGREGSSFTEESSGLPEAQLRRGRTLLTSLNLDKDCLSEEDCLNMMRLMGLNPSSVQFERSMARMSPEPAATCTWGQFCHIWKDAMSAEEHSRAMLEKAFPFFDQDGSGFITCDEMVEQFAELGGLLSPEEIHKFHSVLDRDGNGVIDRYIEIVMQYAEFIAALQPQMADDTPVVVTAAATQPQDAAISCDATSKLLMQPQPGEVPGAQQREVGFRNAAHLHQGPDAGTVQAAQTVDLLDDQGAELPRSNSMVESL